MNTFKSKIHNLKSTTQPTSPRLRRLKMLTALNPTSPRLRRLKVARPAFTIVELIVVIVVIGVLALVLALSYIGVSERAIIASLQSDLANAAKVLEIDRISSDSDSYPANIENANNGNGLIASSDNIFEYLYSSTDNSYTLTAINGSLIYHITSDNIIPVLGRSSFVLYDNGVETVPWTAVVSDIPYACNAWATKDAGSMTAGSTAGAYGCGSGVYGRFDASFDVTGYDAIRITWKRWADRPNSIGSVRIYIDSNMTYMNDPFVVSSPEPSEIYTEDIDVSGINDVIDFSAGSYNGGVYMHSRTIRIYKIELINI